ncbi:MAG: 4Fe-4S ferredoxin [Planctomycetaceae bacterium]|jgi:Fe-S-cluster-containing dehydrogenase component|nr:4Fe-4S ferredoxin [Planctomycetaceae bacterium]MDP7277020.1 4Fe-4S dicluster domain-containing protein [Planctomycetaceae bacterium]
MRDQAGESTDCGCSGDCADSGESLARREFLRGATTVVLGGLSLSYLSVAAADINSDGQSQDGTDGSAAQETGSPVTESPAGNPPEGDILFGFLVDTGTCIGTGKCLSACRTENDVPEGNSRTWVERYVHFKDGRLQVDLVPETGYAGSGLPLIDPDEVDRSYFVPKLCNHCEDAPCTQVCPVHASFTSPEGVELVDPNRCIGCAYCVQACPYGARFINPETSSADKCTWCYHRIMRGEKPACVEACPVDARVFGRLDDPRSEINKRLAKVPASVLKEHLGTHPKLHYLGLSGDVT